jgi:putative transposase
MSENLIVTGEIYHVYNQSIADYIIFNNDMEFSRLIELIQYYQLEKQQVNFSKFKEYNMKYSREDVLDGEKLVEIICYCPMPTHFHLALKQLKDQGISKFINKVFNSYSHYFNIKHNRKGPLFAGRFKRVLVQTDEQLLHLTRYIHLNPVTAGLVHDPMDWKYSSYKEYVDIADGKIICRYKNILDINPMAYKIFVNSRISYQKELARIKKLMVD